MNLKATVEDIIDKALLRFVFVAKVTGTGGGGVTVQPIGSQYPINQTFTILSSYTGAAPGDIVLVVRVGSGYWVLGKK